MLHTRPGSLVDVASPSSITLRPLKHRNHSGIVVHFGIHKSGLTFSRHPFLYLAYAEQAPRRRLYDLSNPGNLSAHRSYACLMITGLKVVCTSINSTRAMNKDIFVIDIWIVESYEVIFFVLIFAIMVQVWQIASQIGVQ
jgi:hypothetical protein